MKKNLPDDFPKTTADWERVIAAAPGEDRALTSAEEARMKNAVVVHGGRARNFPSSKSPCALNPRPWHAGKPVARVGRRGLRRSWLNMHHNPLHALKAPSTPACALKR